MNRTFILVFLTAALSPAAILVEGQVTVNGAPAAVGLPGNASHGHVRIQNGAIISQLNQGGATSGAGPLGSGVTSATATGTAASPNGYEATASADLATATLRAQVLSIGDSDFIQGFAQSILMDTLTFNNTTTGILALDLLLDITGEVMNDANANTFIASNLQLANVNPTPHQVRYRDGGLLGEIIQYNFNRGALSFSSSSGSVNPARWDTMGTGDANAQIGTSILFEPGISIMSVRMLLSVDCRTGSSCDYGDSSGLGFGTVPTGLSYTSESGVFLTGAPTVVPEPMSFVLVAAGLALLAFVGRLRTRRLAGAQ